MATTKPGVELNQEGLCQACVHHRMRKDVDYDERFQHLEEIADRHRSDDGSWDCIIPVSGGKDSHYQAYVVTEELDLNPLLVAVSDPFTKTEAGRHNLQNMADAFGCDLVTLEVSPSTVRTMVRVAFDELGSPTWPIDQAIYCAPLKVGINFGIPLIIYGENVSWEYGGVLDDHEAEESHSAKDQIKNDVAKPVDFDLWYEHGIEDDDLNLMTYPSPSEIEEAELEPIYLSYFRPWDGWRNYQVARKFGFRTLRNEWDRDGYIEHYDQIDSIAYLMNVWMKYPKFGFCRTTDVVGYWRRSPHKDLSLEDGVRLIRQHDHKLDERVLDDFLSFTGLQNREFWKTVESHRNEDIFDQSFLAGDDIPRPVDDFENIDLGETDPTTVPDLIPVS